MLGDQYGLGRPLRISEMAALIGLQPETLRKWEQRSGLTQPASNVVEMMLGGATPPNLDQVIGQQD